MSNPVNRNYDDWPESNYEGSNVNTDGRSRSSSNANSVYSIVEEKQTPHAEGMFVKYVHGYVSGVGEIEKVNEIEEGRYGYTLKDGTTIPHSSIIMVSTHPNLKGGRRLRRKARKSVRRKRAMRRQTRRG